MTSQRRRPEQTQRRLAIQASSRRSRTTTDNRARDNNWDQENLQSAYEEERSYEPFTSERYATDAQQNDWPREHQFRDERYSEPGHDRLRNRFIDADDGHSQEAHHDSDEHYRENRYREDRYREDQYSESRYRDNPYRQERFQEGFEADRYGYGSHDHQDSWERRESYGQPRGRSELDKDLEAMGKVWSMIRQGAVRMLGEVGRQY